MKAIVIEKNGGSEVMQYKDVPTPKPGPGQMLVKLDACGVNYIDVYQRTGYYPMKVPFTPGNEGAGTVEALGPGVTGFRKGATVAWTGVLGSYTQYHLVPADRAVAVPKGVDARTAAATMLQGLTAHYLTRDTHPVKKGEWVLIHAGAGGVGLLLIQMCHQLGAKVITTVSTDDKAKLAKDAGADHVILYTRQDFEQEVNRIAGKNALAVVYDAVGITTFEKGLNLLRPRGLMVLYGQSAGPVPAFDLGVLNAKGSLYITRPGLFHHIATRDVLLKRARAVLGMVRDGKLKIRIGATYPLSQAKAAHDDLEGRRTTGKVLLIP
ncbi:MAG: quinone oxidoreductase [Candidatus Lambdaproteobacteria bacterium]|nr:quinone oxidoreductase [Candidatus Lambdaproteobacteria bacterium]